MTNNEAITQLEIIATNALGRLCETLPSEDERQIEILNKQIEALDVAIELLKEAVECKDCKWAESCKALDIYLDGFCSKGERRTE